MALRIVFLLVVLSFVLAYIPNSVRHRSFDLSSSSCFLLLFFFQFLNTYDISRGFFLLLPPTSSLFVNNKKKKKKKVLSIEKRANTLFRDAIVRIPKNSTNSPRAVSYFDFNFRFSLPFFFLKYLFLLIP